jgi:hypothetical protein
MAALREIYQQLRDHPALAVQSDLMGPLKDLVGLYSQGYPIGLQRVAVSKVDPPEQALIDARGPQTKMLREQKRATEVAAEKERLKRQRHVPTKFQLRTGQIPFERTKYVGTIRSSDGDVLSTALDRYHSFDAESVTVEGDATDIGLHLWIRLFYQSGAIHHNVVFSDFPDSPVDTIRGMTGQAFTGDLDTFQLADTRIAFSTCRCHLRASVSDVPLQPGVNFLAKLACRPNLNRILGAPSHFDLFGPVGDVFAERPALRLQTFPLVDIRLGASTIFKAGFFEMQTVELPLDDGRTAWDLRTTLNAWLEFGPRLFQVWSDVVGDDDQLIFRVNIPAPLENPGFGQLRDLAPLFSSNGDYLAVLPDQRVVSPPFADLITSYQLHEVRWMYDLETHTVTSLTVSIQALNTITFTHPFGAVIALTDIRITWMVGFPDAGQGRPISASAEATATFAGLTFPVSVLLTPQFEIEGSVASIDQTHFSGIVEALKLQRIDPDEFGQPQEAFFRFSWAEGIEISLIDDDAQAVMFVRRS